MGLQNSDALGVNPLARKASCGLGVRFHEQNGRAARCKTRRGSAARGTRADHDGVVRRSNVPPPDCRLQSPHPCNRVFATRHVSLEQSAKRIDASLRSSDSAHERFSMFATFTGCCVRLKRASRTLHCVG